MGVGRDRIAGERFVDGSLRGFYYQFRKFSWIEAAGRALPRTSGPGGGRAVQVGCVVISVRQAAAAALVVRGFSMSAGDVLSRGEMVWHGEEMSRPWV